MATVEVKKPKPVLVSPYSVQGYRPEHMDVPLGPVLKTGPRRPAGGYASNTKTKAPGAIVKEHTTAETRIPSVNLRANPRRAATITPHRFGLRQRVIIPNTGISLPNTNR